MIPYMQVNTISVEKRIEFTKLFVMSLDFTDVKNKET